MDHPAQRYSWSDNGKWFGGMNWWRLFVIFDSGVNIFYSFLHQLFKLRRLIYYLFCCRVCAANHSFTLVEGFVSNLYHSFCLYTCVPNFHNSILIWNLSIYILSTAILILGDYLSNPFVCFSAPKFDQWRQHGGLELRKKFSWITSQIKFGIFQFMLCGLDP